jgi:ribonuclease HI
MYNKYPKIYPEISVDDELTIDDENFYIMRFDGCSKGNPGRAGCGAVIYNPHMKEIWADNLFLGTNMTNNVAEYSGLIIGLTKASNLMIENLRVEGDSMLIIKQMKGEYEVKSPSLYSLYKVAKDYESKFKYIEFHHIYREKNKRADKLSNDALVMETWI